jgi:hypothetical protein
MEEGSVHQEMGLSVWRGVQGVLFMTSEGRYGSCSDGCSKIRNVRVQDGDTMQNHCTPTNAEVTFTVPEETVYNVERCHLIAKP